MMSLMPTRFVLSCPTVVYWRDLAPNCIVPFPETSPIYYFNKYFFEIDAVIAIKLFAKHERSTGP